MSLFNWKNQKKRSNKLRSNEQEIIFLCAAFEKDYAQLTVFEGTALFTILYTDKNKEGNDSFVNIETTPLALDSIAFLAFCNSSLYDHYRKGPGLFIRLYLNACIKLAAITLGIEETTAKQFISNRFSYFNEHKQKGVDFEVALTSLYEEYVNMLLWEECQPVLKEINPKDTLPIGIVGVQREMIIRSSANIWFKCFSFFDDFIYNL